MARPIEWTAPRIAKMVAALEEYTEVTDIPIIAEFAYMNRIRRQMLYERDEFADAIKRLIAKKEAQLERLGLAGVVDRSMAIFSLKQLGWSDKREVEHSGGIVERVFMLTDADDQDTDPAEAEEADREPV